MNIKVTLKNYRCFSDSNPARIELGRGVTAFVGANNSGKSTILRFLYEFRPLFQTLASNEEYLKMIMTNRFSLPHPLGVEDQQQLFFKGNSRPIEIDILISELLDNSYPHANKRVCLRIKHDKSCVLELDGESEMSLQKHSVVFPPNGLIEVTDQKRVVGNMALLKELFSMLSNTMYVGAHRGIGPTGASGNCYDISVGSSFVRTWDDWKAGKQAATREEAHTFQREIGQLFGFETFEINASHDQNTLQVTVNGKGFTVQELGSGLGNFILVLTQAVMKRPEFILIDEPESSLHASMQMNFVSKLADYAMHGVLFSTHNLGLAKSVANSIYAVHKEDFLSTSVRRYEENPRLTELLGALNFSLHREVGYSSILLAEGVNDVRVLRQFLAKLHLCHKIALLPLGGDGMINGDRSEELEEVRRIAGGGRVYALVDSEKTSENAPLPVPRMKFKNACDVAGIECCVLQRRAIENYFPEKAIRAVFGQKSSALGSYDTKPSWPKPENWQVAREMNIEDLQGTDLGDFLSKLTADNANQLSQ